VDADGNIDPKTGFLFDYNSVSSIYAYRIDDTPIVLDGGEGCTVTTLSSQVPLAPYEYKGISRSLNVSRCNASVKNVEHVIYNEPTDYGTSGSGKTSGHTYSGFFYAGDTYNVEFRDCVVQARNRCIQGTYDIGVYNAVDVRFINVTQSNFYEEGGTVPNTGKCWFVMGSNFCKNLTYDGCALTRFDAHCGVYNATIKNSTISSIRLTGGGHFLMENTTVIARRSADQGFIELREDYGSTWNGTIEIKDCTYKNAWGMSANTLYLITAIWVNHNFGYQTHLPNVIVDNLKLASGHSSIKNIEIFNLSNGSDLDDAVDTEPDFEEGLVTQDFRQPILHHTNGTTKTNVNPYIAPKSIIIKNNLAELNYKAPTHVVFENTKFGEGEKPLPDFDFDTPIIDVFK
jgi:hypothetical protein